MFYRTSSLFNKSRVNKKQFHNQKRVIESRFIKHICSKQVALYKNNVLSKNTFLKVVLSKAVLSKIRFIQQKTFIEPSF